MRPGYKQTEVGVIPEDWEVARLAAACSMKSGEGITSANIDQFSKYPCYGGNGLRGRASRFTHDGSYALIGRQGALCGNVLGVEGQFFASEHAIVVTAFAQTDIRWLTYVLGEMNLNQYSESSAQPGLSVSKILNLDLSIPPTKAEQRAIAKVLSDVDALLGALERLIAKKRDLKQAAMQQLLTGQTRLPGFHGEWELKRLGSLGAFLKGSGVRKDEALSGDLPCVRYGEIYTHHHDVVRVFNTFLSPSVASAATPLRKGDLLFAASGETKEEIGKAVAFAHDYEAYAGGDIVILRPEASDSVFLGYYLNSPPIQKQKASRGQGDAVVHISATSLAAIEVTVPFLPEQTAIATVLTDMDAELAALTHRLTKTRALKQGMMQELLTGRTRLVAAEVAS
jgi:type I restriction enzyme S subunit